MHLEQRSRMTEGSVIFFLSFNTIGEYIWWNSVNICVLVIIFDKSIKWIILILKIYVSVRRSSLPFLKCVSTTWFQNFCQELKLRGNYMLRNVNFNSGKASEIKLSISNDRILTFVFGFPDAWNLNALTFFKKFDVCSAEVLYSVQPQCDRNRVQVHS